MREKNVKVMDWAFVVGTLLILGAVGVFYFGEHLV